MNCLQIRQYFDDLLDEAIGPIQEQVVLNHLAHCPTCREALDNELAFRRRLRELPVATPSPGFGAHALRQAAASTHHSGYAKGFASAAAIALVWLGANLMMPEYAPNSHMPGLTLRLNEVRQVDLVFDSPEHMPHAHLAMELPAHMELAGYPEQHRLAWQATLHKGENRLTLPIVARTRQSGELVATISFSNQKKTFRIRLDVGQTPDAPHAERIHPGVA